MFGAYFILCFVPAGGHDGRAPHAAPGADFGDHLLAERLVHPSGQASGQGTAEAARFQQLQQTRSVSRERRKRKGR